MYDSLRVRQKPFFLSLATNYDKFTLSIKLHYILMRFVISAGHVLPRGRASSDLHYFRRVVSVTRC